MHVCSELFVVANPVISSCGCMVFYISSVLITCYIHMQNRSLSGERACRESVCVAILESGI